MYSPNAFCNSDRNVMAASRLLGAMAGWAIDGNSKYLSIAGGQSKSYRSGCIKAAIVI